MTLRTKLLTVFATAVLMAPAAIAQTTSYRNDLAPAAFLEGAAKHCMDYDYQVATLTQTQLQCRKRLDRVQGAHILFTRFGQSRYSDQIFHVYNYVVLPDGTGSQVQGVEQYEATINGEVRRVDAR